ncbi:Aminopeptidase I zinc metalloprotease (M18) [Pseudoloma neurophilia]|uniref:aspartyl aminopeptidase n=1 Tax=Pseudoloma neurophilia TaxID=146866 RepID=A0A0R0M0W9_9MICR|nr:Aminopeptidase I zinc metalloprotease (M18) [Pseudoloma neurophilia]
MTVERYLEFLNNVKTPYHLGWYLMTQKKLPVVRNLNELKKSGTFVYRPNDTLIFLIKIPENPDNIRMVVTHSDSPCLKLKGNGIKSILQYIKKETNGDPRVKMPTELSIPVRPYGGGLFNTFFDRLLVLTGFVVCKIDGKLVKIVVHDMGTAILPSLPPHLNHNNVYEQGKVKFEINRAIMVNAECESMSIERQGIEALSDIFMGQELDNGDMIRFKQEDIIGHDISLIDKQEPVQIGKFIHSGRQDNLLSTFAAVDAILFDDETIKKNSNDVNQEEKMIGCRNIQVMLATDFEEIGSEKLEGAYSHVIRDLWKFLNSKLCDRIVKKPIEGQDDKISDEKKNIEWNENLILSADVSHCYNQNFSGHYDPDHKLEFGQSVTIKRSNHYATDAIGEAFINDLCVKNDIPFSVYENKTGIRGGCTVGSILSCLIGERVIDIGTPVFAMHSAREMACVDDVSNLSKLFRVFFNQ